MLLNNQQITEEIKKEIKICIETNENENTTTQTLWDTLKAVLRGKFIAIQAHLNKQEKSQINNLTLHLKQLEKEEMKNPRVSRRKEILKISALLLLLLLLRSRFSRVRVCVTPWTAAHQAPQSLGFSRQARGTTARSVSLSWGAREVGSPKIKIYVHLPLISLISPDCGMSGFIL